MTGAILKMIIGLFIWMALPGLIFQTKSKKKAPYKRFITVLCAFVGVLIIAFGIVGLVKTLFHTILS
jgi:hypothetical protein